MTSRGYSSRSNHKNTSFLSVFRFRSTYLFLGVLLGLTAVVIGIAVFGRIRGESVSSVITDSLSSEILGTRDDFQLPGLFENINLNGSKKWFLIGDEFALGDRDITVWVDVANNERAMLRINNATMQYEIVETGQTGSMKRSLEQNDRYQVTFSTADLEPGTYHVVVSVSVDDTEYRSNQYEFYVSYPVYVAWTMDWEGYNVSPQYLDDIAQISHEHNDLPITHFFNPRIYTSPDISESDQARMTNWVLNRRDENGDLIALHLHMFPDMVEAAGVEPAENPLQWGSELKDGYDILTSQYSYEDMSQILGWSRLVFAENGLPIPQIFRAGGWYAEENTLEAVQDSGFIADSSGREAYQFGNNNIRGPWDLSVNTQPYYPSVSDQNKATGDTLDILEIPNNGGDSWAYSTDSLKNRFDQNYSGSTLDDFVVVTYLSHPEWFRVDKPKMEELFTYIDEFLYASDKGPVVYVTLDAVVDVNK